MIRQPTSEAKLYEFHRQALLGLRLDVVEGEPQCGWYRQRMKKSAPWLPVRIWMHQEIDENGDLAGPEALLCLVAGDPRSPGPVWSHCAKNPITSNHYDELMAAFMGRLNQSGTPVGHHGKDIRP